MTAPSKDDRKEKWTRGEWFVVRCNNYISIRSDKLISSIIKGIGGGSIEKREANAHLIAAAPKLYEVAEEALDLLLAIAPHYEVIEKLQSVLARARGEKP